MEDREARIIATAVALAEQGGFEAVRLRDVAAHAGVALGTNYPLPIVRHDEARARTLARFSVVKAGL